MFEVMAEKCDQCLMSKGKIVDDERRWEILETTERRDCHFICHKATIAGRDIACRGHFDATGGGKVGRFATWIGCVRKIDWRTLEPVS